MAARPQHAAHFPEGTRGLLVLASASQDPRATASIVAGMMAREDLRIHVAAVRSPPSPYARRFLRSVDVASVLEAGARESLAPLCRELDALGIIYRTHVVIAPWLEGIERLVRDLGCSRIALGTGSRSVLGNAALRLDRWLLERTLRTAGCECDVVRGDERLGRRQRRMAPGSAVAR